MADKNIVIDNGSGVLKAGFSEETQPSVKFPSIVGVPRGEAMIGVDQKSEYIGDEAQKMRGVLKLAYPIESGIVTDWDNMNKVWEYAFNNELRCDPSEHNVLLTEAPGNPKANREKMTEIMFEQFQVNGLYVAIQAVMSLYANGRTTGLVGDSGDGVTHTVPVFEGFSIPHAIGKNFIAGRAISKYMEELLTLDGIASQGGAGAWLQIVRTIKEKTCFIAQDYEKTLAEAGSSNQHNKDFELPDGQVVQVNTPRFKAPELIFKPALAKQGDETLGLAELCIKSINDCDVDVRTDLYANVILSGGSTLYEGIDTRLNDEIEKKAPKAGMTKIIAPPDRYYSVWSGAATLCSLSTFSGNWITKEDYDDAGAEIVHRKCV